MKFDNKKCLITGATGFIGAYLCQRLLLDGWNVHIITRKQTNLLALNNRNNEITIHEHDGTMKSMLSIMENVLPNIVFHLASCFIAQHTKHDVEKLIASNILFGSQLLEAMAQCGTSQLINTGTSWQHYNNQSYEPVCLYAATKQAFNDIVLYYVSSTPLRVVTLELFDTYGPKDSRQKLFAFLRKTAYKNIKLAMSPGDQLIDLVYIDDVINAFISSITQCDYMENGQMKTFAISSGKPIKLKDLVALYAKITKKEVQINWGERPYRPREVMIPWNMGKQLPNWTPSVDLEEGIKRMEHLL